MIITFLAKMHQAVSNLSGHADYLKHILQYMKSIQCKSSANFHVRLTDIYRCTFDAVGGSKLPKCFKFLLANRLNEECIENLFSLIRAKDAQRDNPDAGQFRATFQEVMLDNVTVPSKSANCEADVNCFIFSLKHMKEAPSTSTEHELSSVIDQVPLPVKVILFACTSAGKVYAQGLSH